MTPPDGFAEQYMKHFDGTYDSVDRILLNAYFQQGQSPGGFRFWRRMLMDGDTERCYITRIFLP